MDLRAILKAVKVGLCLRPQLKNNGAFANNTYFDTQGVGSVLFLLAVGDTDVAVGSGDTSTAPLVEECDTTGGTYTAVSGAALSGVIAATDDNKVFGIHVDLAKSHKRYMRIKAPTAANGTTGANLAIIALGFPPDVSPGSASEMGLEELVEA